MKVVTVRIDEAAFLSRFPEPVEFRTEDGESLGHFTPSPETIERYAAARAHFDPEEIRRLKASPGPWYSTAEVMRMFQSLEKGEAESFSNDFR